MKSKPVILWFRQDLRLADNPALEQAAETGRPILPVFILDQHGPVRPWGAASLWWLDGSLRALDESLKARGSRLIVRRGDAESELRRLCEETGADAVFMNRRFEPDAFAHDADIAHALEADGIACRGFNGSLLCRPGGVLTGAGKPYRVFTPFKNALLAQASAPPHTLGPRAVDTPENVTSEAIDDWALTPTRPDWATGFDWTPGETAAQAALSAFVADGLATYCIGRDHPAKAGASRLSPHLHWGELHPWRVVERVRDAAADGRAPAKEAEKFVSELVWRDFSMQLVHLNPQMTEQSLRPEYDAMPWRDDEPGFRAWTRGMTGYPIVDAGLRQLWSTGWMHNRVRMIAASFLVKDLLIDWRRGEAWFWDTLVDADLGNNVQNWQWIAGSGADAWPWFRIFNPVTQGEKFDPDGIYVKRWVPELARLDRKWVHQPWAAPAEALKAAGVTLGDTYPKPIVDHGEARARALDALKSVTRDKIEGPHED